MKILTVICFIACFCAHGQGFGGGGFTPPPVDYITVSNDWNATLYFGYADVRGNVIQYEPTTGAPLFNGVQLDPGQSGTFTMPTLSGLASVGFSNVTIYASSTPIYASVGIYATSNPYAFPQHYASASLTSDSPVQQVFSQNFVPEPGDNSFFFGTSNAVPVVPVDASLIFSGAQSHFLPAILIVVGAVSVLCLIRWLVRSVKWSGFGVIESKLQRKHGVGGYRRFRKRRY